jgi:CheY-like chemotaxis protein
LNFRAQSEEPSHESNAADLPGLAPAAAFEGFIATSADTEQWVGKETILLAEEEAFVRKATGEALESAGYRVVVASSAAQALEAQRNCGEQVDLLLSDLVMPGISGHELANQLLVLCPNVRVLLMSGYAEQLALCQLSSYGRKYLAKPFSIPVLLRRVREVLDTNLQETDPLDTDSLYRDASA